MSLENLLLFGILILLPVNWWATWQLWNLSHENKGLQTLRERAVSAVTLTIAITIFASMVVLVSTGSIEGETATLIRRASVILLTLPAVYWLWLARRSS